jgi:deoxyribodipyrimidine photo-lyase
MSAQPDLKSILARVKELAAQSSQPAPSKSPRTDASAPSSKRSKVQKTEDHESKGSSSSGAAESADDGSSKRSKPIAPAREVHRDRVRLVNSVGAVPPGGCVVYWMSRDQRVRDNWALLEASRLAKASGAVLRVVFCLVPKFLDATIRHFGFMCRGLKDVEKDCVSLQIPFHLLRGTAVEVLPQFLREQRAAAVVTDLSPLRVPRRWVADVGSALAKLSPPLPLYQVDAHNVVPLWKASDKQEYGARTIRPKIEALLPEFLTEFPDVPPNSSAVQLPDPVDWNAVISSLEVDRSVGEVAGIVPGAEAAAATLASFIAQRLKIFAADRNDPNKNALSGLSPYLHFGQIGAQRCALAVKLSGGNHESVKSFLEESIVRRELADNFCWFAFKNKCVKTLTATHPAACRYCPNYDSLDCAFPWAKESLLLHSKDKREYVYSYDELEQSKTHDALWNAAQRQMLLEGKMHGFLRMYWAKKILEWTASPEQALAFGIKLNDRLHFPHFCLFAWASPPAADFL